MDCSFYPRPPRGGRLKVIPYDTVWHIVSIHALREEGDPVRADLGVGDQSFYPRPPRGGRPSNHARHIQPHSFYPRPPRGGRPGLSKHTHIKGKVSIHALREEGDKKANTYYELGQTFLSTPSARRATVRHDRTYQQGLVSIHALREEGDLAHVEGKACSSCFYPRPPRGGRPNH